MGSNSWDTEGTQGGEGRDTTNCRTEPTEIECWALLAYDAMVRQATTTRTPHTPPSNIVRRREGHLGETVGQGAISGHPRLSSASLALGPAWPDTSAWARASARADITNIEAKTINRQVVVTGLAPRTNPNPHCRVVATSGLTDPDLVAGADKGDAKAASSGGHERESTADPTAPGAGILAYQRGVALLSSTCTAFIIAPAG
jgi:hypothetical protein